MYSLIKPGPKRQNLSRRQILIPENITTIKKQTLKTSERKSATSLSFFSLEAPYKIQLSFKHPKFVFESQM